MTISITADITISLDGSPVTTAKTPAELVLSLANFSPSSFGLSNITSALWSFGDGLSSTILTPTHTYGMPGQYTVSCTFVISYLGSLLTYTETTTLIVTRQVNVFNLNKCYRNGFYESQGFGPQEFSGDYWPQFPVGVGGGMCYDDNDQPHHIVFDEQYGVFYEISEPNGPTGSGLAKKWTDDDATGTAHEITSEISLAECTGDRQHFQIEHNETHLYFKPFNEDTRGTTGYDAFGYRNVQQVDVDWFMDGEQATPDGVATNIPKLGEIVSDRKLYGQRGRAVLNMAAAEYVLTGYDQYWVEKDQAIDISETPNTESDNQLSLSVLDVWVTRGNPSPLFDRVSGSVLAGAGAVNAVQGADAKSNSGFAPGVPLSFGSSLVFSSTGYIAFFYYGTISSVKLNGVTQTITDYAAGAFTAGSYSWKLGTIGIASPLSAAGPLVITPAFMQALILFDLRICASKVISASDLLYLYNDVRYNAAENVCPIW